MIKHSKGRYTDTQIDRCAKLSGPFGDRMKALFNQAIGREEGRNGAECFHEMYDTEIKEFVAEFYEDKLVKYVKGRKLPRLDIPQKHESSVVKNPYMLGKYISMRCNAIDRWSRIAAETARRVNVVNQN